MIAFESRTWKGKDLAANTRFLTASPDSIAAVAASYQVSLGALDRGGATLRRFFVMVATALTPNGTDYYTFQPFFYRIDKEAGTQVIVGTPRSTLTTPLAAGVPFRLHDEANLRKKPGGSVSVGVTVTVAGTPAGAQLLVRPTFYGEYSV